MSVMISISVQLIGSFIENMAQNLQFTYFSTFKMGERNYQGHLPTFKFCPFSFENSKTVKAKGGNLCWKLCAARNCMGGWNVFYNLYFQYSQQTLTPREFKTFANRNSNFFRGGATL